ncbi:MAG TPA: hypothetical protein PKD16_17905 [Saprospiraceae bacterium]|jgi:hypothetical protein|nr:hypothetical protein [Saprospiraceae bacterium]HMT72048.1 hypothetical protein [Saprospiraceae bacterium]
MILKKGLQFLQQNPNLNDISNLLYLKEIPVNYLFLLKNFKLGDFCFSLERIFIESDIETYTSYDHNYFHFNSDQKLYITGLFDIPRVNYELNSYINAENYWHQAGYIEIGYVQNNLLLLNLNINGNGDVCIYKDVYDKDLGFFVLSNDVIEFISQFEEIIIQDYINQSNLYKNWNEDFWRIKPSDFRDARPYELLDKDSLDKRYSELKKSDADLLEIESEYKVRGLDLPKKFLFW